MLQKVQPLLLTLDKGYLLTAALPDLQRGIAPLGSPAPAQPPLFGCVISLHGCSSKVQPLLLSLDEGYLLTAALPDLQCGIAPLGPPAPAQPGLWVTPLVATPGLGRGLLLPAAACGLGHGGVG